MDYVIQFEGTIYEQGYGLIAQKVMRDKELSPVSKSIYAYLCSFAGVGKDGERTAFPGVSLMMAELNIKTDDTFYKYRKQLVQKGYIKVEKRRQVGAKFDSNIYKIVAVPVELPKEQLKEEPKKQQETENKPSPNLSGMEKPYPNFSSTEKPSTVKSGTIINSFNINSLNKREEEEEKAARQENEEKESAKEVEQEQSPEYEMALALLERTVGKVNAATKEDLMKWTSILDLSIIMSEIQYAAINNAKTYVYIQRMFIEDHKLQIDSLDKLEEKREKHGKKKNTSSPMRSSKPKKSENLPEWFEKHKRERNGQLEENEAQENVLSPEMEEKKKALLESLGIVK